MNLAEQDVTERESNEKFNDKFANVSEKTAQLSMLFISFADLENKVRSHEDKPHPRFLKWVINQEVKYYNAFVDRFFVEMGYIAANAKLKVVSKPPKLFIELRKLVLEKLKEE
ncbi:hypothetical protein OYT88_11775 [Sporolactobacillus sp. CQH2019]|uniref:hypothetical protein n=1 Tax=Sporolactobacillus sp. CQH2019 TaxID=3023512 RepID=UPI002368A05E|nr:hypothetical protein [Sporolactobacillus sp. CQH2019]MDD9149232.1 hypothetical protein [Sporolactobacillus sp. CQH2019]